MENEAREMEKPHSNGLQVKICGLTRVDEALGCVRMGADAIGCVFFPPSPRHISDQRARDIGRALPPETTCVGVFVNVDYDFIMYKADFCGLGAVQLHGLESPDLARRLGEQGLIVIKALFLSKKPTLTDAELYSPTAYLLECGQGRLPGGNARAWDWKAADGFHANGPFILAGGLSPDNVATAVAACHPDAVDVSSGVEAHPGRKDLERVRAFVKIAKNAINVAKAAKPPKARTIFGY